MVLSYVVSKMSEQNLAQQSTDILVMKFNVGCFYCTANHVGVNSAAKIILDVNLDTFCLLLGDQFAMKRFENDLWCLLFVRV